MIAVALFGLLAFFLLWQIENERMERVRAALIDRLTPLVELGNKPIEFGVFLSETVQEHFNHLDRITGLEQEVTRLEHWREEARRLEIQNAQLRELLNVKIAPAELTVSGRVLADTSSQFRHSKLINVGTERGIDDGWSVMDDEGLVGRISGIGRKTARVILLADSSSRVPVKIEGTGGRGIVTGDGTLLPLLEFVSPAQAKAGRRVLTSGDGGVFPPDLLVGEVVIASDRRLRVKLAADLWNLEFVSVMRSRSDPVPANEGELILTPKSASADG